MTVRPLPGVLPKDAADQLDARALTLANVMGATGDAHARRHDYQRWAADTYRALGFILTPASLEPLLRSPGHATLHQELAAPAGVLIQLVENEITRLTHAFKDAADHLRSLAWRWGQVRTIVVVDTSMLLHHERELAGINWSGIAEARMERVDVVITTVVLNELDKIKDGPGRKPIAEGVHGDTRTRARRTLRFIAERFSDPLAATQLSQFSLEDQTADVILHLDVDPLGYGPLAVADAELVDRAVALRDITGSRVVVAAHGATLGLRARMEGLRSFSAPLTD